MKLYNTIDCYLSLKTVVIYYKTDINLWFLRMKFVN